MNTRFTAFCLGSLLCAVSIANTGCTRRMTVATGTTIGLHASPGDGQSRPPEITLAYKRVELALVPTAGTTGKKNPESDAFSSLAVLDFQTRWWRETKIDQFIATGIASREIQDNGPEFTQALASGGNVRDDVVEAQIYQALKLAAREGNEKAAHCVRDMDALGQLVPEDYVYLEVISTPPLKSQRKIARRSANPDYSSLTAYRAHLKGTLNALNSEKSITIKELDGFEVTLADEALKREVNRHELALASLQQQIREKGATQRALDHYVKTLRR